MSKIFHLLITLGFQILLETFYLCMVVYMLNIYTEVQRLGNVAYWTG